MRYVVLLWQYSDGGERGGRAGREHGRFGSRHPGGDDFADGGIIRDFGEPQFEIEINCVVE